MVSHFLLSRLVLTNLCHINHFIDLPGHWPPHHGFPHGLSARGDQTWKIFIADTFNFAQISSQGEVFFPVKKVPLHNLKLQIYFLLLHVPIDIFYLYAIKLTSSFSFFKGQALPENTDRSTNFPDSTWIEMWTSCSICAMSKSWHVGWARRRLWRCTSTRALIRLFSHNNPFLTRKCKVCFWCDDYEEYFLLTAWILALVTFKMLLFCVILGQ